MDNYDALKIEHQICFPLYACAKEVVRKYKPFLDKIDLTYTQYITMMVMWEKKHVNVKDLGSRLYLDSGTLTPLLKKLEAKGLITRKRSAVDERCLDVQITDKGEALREEAVGIPSELSACVNISEEEARTLYSLLYRVLDTVSPRDEEAAEEETE